VIRMTGKKEKPFIVVTAGPTREKIDPVRFISNHSTGTFGYAIAREAARRGCRVTLISGPTNLERPDGVKLVMVESALEMRSAVKKVLAQADCVIMAAAVSDWRAKKIAGRKLKRHGGKMFLELVENPDIVREIGAAKKKGTIIVGFALETEALVKNALAKLRKKNLDIIIANRLERGKGLFGDTPVDVVIADKYGAQERFPGQAKNRLAKIILDKVFSFNI